MKSTKLKEPTNHVGVSQFGLVGEQIQETFRKILYHQNTNQSDLLKHLRQFENDGFKTTKHDKS